MVILLLAGCAKRVDPDSAQQAFLVDTGAAHLDTLLARATEANLMVARLEAAGNQSRAPKPASDLPPGVTLPADLEQLISLDWTGPAEPLLEALASHIDYEYKVTGPPPAQPLIVTISRRDEPVWMLLRDVAISLTTSATIIVNPSRESVTLQYPVHR